jgi:hypothetical protein
LEIASEIRMRWVKDMQLSASEFWRLYEANAFATLRRSERGDYAGILKSGSGDRANASAEVSRETLLDYAYADDPLFAGWEETPDACIRSLLRSQPFLTENPLNRAVLTLLEMAFNARLKSVPLESYSAQRARMLERCEKRPLPLYALCRVIEEEKPTEEDRLLYAETRDRLDLRCERATYIRVLGMLGQQEAAPTLYDVLVNEHEDAETLYVTACALANLNRKREAGFLIGMLGWDVAPRCREGLHHALQMLCSGETLLLGEPTGDLATVWEETLEGLPKDRISWLRHDIRSVFWEKRLFCARYAPESGALREVLPVLADDEVPMVRQSALARLRALEPQEE